LANARTSAENAGQIIRRRGGSSVAAEGEKWRGERALKKKMLINDVGTSYVYENKQNDDTLSTIKDDIFAQLNAISMTFCTKAKVFCGNRRLFSPYSGAGE
jgi:hypothetical protein